MKEANSADEFLNLLGTAVNGPIFNYFHASCAYHRLASWQRKGKLAKTAASLELRKLNARVREMIEEGQLNAQALANVLWSLAYLFGTFQDVVDMLPAIAAQIPVKAKDMKPQELSNALWAAANLKDDAPDVLQVVPSIVAQIPLKAKDMIPQQLSNILWAAANLKDDAPDVLDMVPSIVAQVPVKTKDMNAQDLSNILWAAANLKDDAPDVLDMVPSIVAQIPLKANDMIPQHLSNNLWAAAKMKDDAPDVLDTVPLIVAQIPLKAKDMIPQQLSNTLWAAANLKDDTPDVLDMVPSIVAQIPLKAKVMIPQELSNTLVALLDLQDLVPGVKSFLVNGTGSKTAFIEVAASRMVKLIPKLKRVDMLISTSTVVWACAHLELSHDDLLTSVAKHLGSTKRVSSLSAWNLCALCGSYQILDPMGRFTDFSEMLNEERKKRRLSESDVGWSLEGPLEWVRISKWCLKHRFLAMPKNDPARPAHCYLLLKMSLATLGTAVGVILAGTAKVETCSQPLPTGSWPGPKAKLWRIAADERRKPTSFIQHPTHARKIGH